MAHTTTNYAGSAPIKTDSNAETAIIILNYNGYQDTIDCLESIGELTTRNYAIILIDNDSRDNSVNRLTKWSEGRYHIQLLNGIDDQIILSAKSINLLCNRENLGFAAGCNQGIHIAANHDIEFLWILNNDTVVTPESLKTLIAFLKKNPDYQVVTPQIRLFAQPDTLWNCGGYLSPFGFRRYYFANSNIDQLPDRESVDITFVTGCAPVVRTTCMLGMGGFTERFFFGEEDFDFSIRMKNTRQKMACCLKSIIFHKVSSSIDETTKTFSLSKTYIHYLNRYINLRIHWSKIRWYPWRLVYAAYIFFLIGRKINLKTSLRLQFLARLFRDSSVHNGVSKDLFKKIINNQEYFQQK